MMGGNADEMLILIMDMVFVLGMLAPSVRKGCSLEFSAVQGTHRHYMNKSALREIF